MKRYRSRPVEVSAFQFDPYGVHRKLPDGIVGVKIDDGEQMGFIVQTVLGPKPIAAGDWIVITDDGNWRACEREAFEGGFDLVEPRSKLLVPSHMNGN